MADGSALIAKDKLVPESVLAVYLGSSFSETAVILAAILNFSNTKACTESPRQILKE